MKKVLTISIMLALVSAMYAEAPEMQKYLPTEWKYMNKYDGELKQKILDTVKEAKNRDYSSERADFMYIATNKYGGTEGCFKCTYLLDPDYGKEILNSGITLHPNSEKHWLYEEKLGGHTFYYYVEHESDEYPTNMYLMYLKDGELIGYTPASYNYIEKDDGYRVEPDTVYGTYLIPGKKHKIKAVCRGLNRVKNNRGLYSHVYYQLLEKQPLGYWADKPVGIKEAGFYAGGFLYDRNNPLRYSLSNAFDGDPSTSFVEDTKDNLLHIQVSDPWEVAFPGGFSEFKIINGYAQNEDLYKKNNRPKLIKTGGNGKFHDADYLCKETDDKCFLDDNTLGWQKFKFHIDQYFLVKDIYKGTRYSDTCIAELDFKYDGGTGRRDREYVDAIGWLFSSEPDGE